MSFYMFLEDSNSFRKKVIKLPKNIIIRLQYCKHKQEKNSKKENLKPSKKYIQNSIQKFKKIK